MLAVGRRSVVSRAIRAVGLFRGVIYIDSALYGFIFSVSGRSPNGRDLFDVMYVGPVLPFMDELDRCQCRRVSRSKSSVVFKLTHDLSRNS
jgi:hypothetical protein